MLECGASECHCCHGGRRTAIVIADGRRTRRVVIVHVYSADNERDDYNEPYESVQDPGLPVSIHMYMLGEG